MADEQLRSGPYGSRERVRAYAAARQADPRIAQRIWEALGVARSVLNVGAGTGSYEPRDREVVALEPSEGMIALRPVGSARAIHGSAEAIPLAGGSVDAAMALLSAHHFSDVRLGLDEMRRVARGRIVVLTWDPDVLAAFWPVAGYVPAIVDGPAWRAASPERVTAIIGGRVEIVPIPHDCRDGFLGAYWRRPEAYLDPRVRAGISALADPVPAAAAGLERLAADLVDGTWRRRHGHLLGLTELDLGYRLVVSDSG